MNAQEKSFLENQLDILKNKAFDFQNTCDNNLSSKDNVLLSMPTGSGKTDRYLIWAIDNLLKSNKASKIIITAPIKALSNQRFKELYLAGYNVGIETGDIKYKVDESTILCCTQEIATNKYTSSDYIVVIDEFHYIYSDVSRSRAYIDFLVNSNAKNILICSATLGNLDDIKSYLDDISRRDFSVCHSDDRLTDLEIKEEIELADIKNAYVIAFNHKDCKKYAKILRLERKIKKLSDITEEKKSIVLKTASKYNLNSSELVFNALFGIGFYYGDMLTKEKLFVSELFEMKIIDTVFSTDAISLGVNFPIENIVFTTFKKCGKNIDKNLFDQIIGRAGRYGFFDTGYIYYCTAFTKDKKIKNDFESLKKQSGEDIEIRILPSIRNILNGKTTLHDEVLYVDNNSTADIDIDQTINNLIDDLKLINEFDIEESFAQQLINHKLSPKKYKPINWRGVNPDTLYTFNTEYKGINKYYMKTFKEVLPLFYDDEFSPIQNCILIRDVICGFDENKIISDVLYCKEREYRKHFRMILQIRKFLYKLPLEYRYYIDLDALDEKLSNIDPTVFDIEYSFQEYSNFGEYSSSDLQQMIKDVQSKNKINEEQESKKKKQKSFNRPFVVGSIIRNTNEPGSYNYMVLRYSADDCILLNYSLYKNGYYSMKVEPNLNGYSFIELLSDEEYDMLYNEAKKNSYNFIPSDNAKRKHVRKITRVMKNNKQPKRKR